MAKCKGLYFGTYERMVWVPAPRTDVSLGSTGWGTSGTMLNGGAYVRDSTAKHRTYNMSWPLKKHEELAPLEDFYHGVYGSGPFHMLLPGTYDNVLPVAWSVPRLAIDDAMPLVRGPRPVEVSLGSTSGRPPVAAKYEIVEELERRQMLTIPVPPEMYLHVGVHGTFTGTARMRLTNQNITPLSLGSTVLTNTVVQGPGLYELSLQGTGEATISAMTARITDSSTPPTGAFVTGRGTSAVDFEPNTLDITMSSAAKNMYHGSATFVEVGQWL